MQISFFGCETKDFRENKQIIKPQHFFSLNASNQSIKIKDSLIFFLSGKSKKINYTAILLVYFKTKRMMKFNRLTGKHI
jgi:hypothetical protein